jgi:hypothetical protein
MKEKIKQNFQFVSTDSTEKNNLSFLFNQYCILYINRRIDLTTIFSCASLRKATKY